MSFFKPNLLNIDQDPRELAELYGPKDYYWYLRSPQFREAFIKPIAAIVNRLGSSCLDVGCGEGVLGEYVTGDYLGIDGSFTAVTRAKRDNVILARLEQPTFITRSFDTVVFGSIMEVLIKPECRVALLEMYQAQFTPGHFIIYDLERLDTSLIASRYALVEEYHYSAADIDVLEVKKHRKILVFKCS